MDEPKVIGRRGSTVVRQSADGQTADTITPKRQSAERQSADRQSADSFFKDCLNIIVTLYCSVSEPFLAWQTCKPSELIT